MQFFSDNWSGVHPDIVAAIAAEAEQDGGAYGSSATDAALNARFGALFQTEVSVFTVGTGTAANSLALAACQRPGGVVFCHAESHLEVDECGALALQGDGMRTRLIAGADGRIAPEGLAAAIASFPPGHIHAGQPVALSITQATEAGTVYPAAAIQSLSTLAKAHGLVVHMDGARLANAVAALGQSPADVTWRAGVDILSFGATKNGCAMADAIVVFDPRLAEHLPHLRMRAGHLMSKSRFIAAQLVAYLEDNLWLEMAGHANRLAARLRAGIDASDAARLAWATQANEVFAVLRTEDVARLRAAGAGFAPWPSANASVGDDETVIRLVASFNTTEADVDAFLALLAA